jgi:hypothetical protein
MESCRIHERIIAVRDAISGKSNSRASGTSVAALGAARFRLRG